jgi:hypothetical protein
MLYESILLKNFLPLFLLFVTCCSLAYSQEITVTGRSYRQRNGLPLEQVSVAVKEHRREPIQILKVNSACGFNDC